MMSAVPVQPVSLVLCQAGAETLDRTGTELKEHGIGKRLKCSADICPQFLLIWLLLRPITYLSVPVDSLGMKQHPQ